ncbi:hypothetical protein LF1_28340 [Rubripirellula obstinata]|uniref:Uncharacterized protein n=1 Tax=Rubripirellula obstinata TaxID=406547 RepID=A0A5B1CKA1_9BACT|nr:hypothetical protein LF1_28340 [Rubripirellula obstinata]
MIASAIADCPGTVWYALSPFEILAVPVWDYHEHTIFLSLVFLSKSSQPRS